MEYRDKIEVDSPVLGEIEWSWSLQSFNFSMSTNWRSSETLVKCLSTSWSLNSHFWTIIIVKNVNRVLQGKTALLLKIFRFMFQKTEVQCLLKEWFMVWSQVEKYKNVGQSGNVYEIQTFWAKQTCHRSIVSFMYSFNKCLWSIYYVVASVTVSNKKWSLH